MENYTEGETKLESAVNTLTESLKSDGDLRQAYIANIAMAFKDTFFQYKSEKGMLIPSGQDIHNISNKAAEYFIQVLCNEIQYPEGR